MRDDASIVPYKQFIGLRQIFTLLRGGVRAPRPANNFQVWQRIIKCSVGNGLDRSENLQTMSHKIQIWRIPGTVKTVPYKSFFDLTPIAIKPK